MSLAEVTAWDLFAAEDADLEEHSLRVVLADASDSARLARDRLELAARKSDDFVEGIRSGRDERELRVLAFTVLSEQLEERTERLIGLLRRSAGTSYVEAQLEGVRLFERGRRTNDRDWFRTAIDAFYDAARYVVGGADSSITAWFLGCIYAFDLMDGDGAIRAFDEVPRYAPDNARQRAALAELGAAFVHFAERRHDEAERAARRAVQEDSGLGLAHFELAKYLILRDEHAEALAELEAAIRLRPTLFVPAAVGDIVSTCEGLDALLRKLYVEGRDILDDEIDQLKELIGDARETLGRWAGDEGWTERWRAEEEVETVTKRMERAGYVGLRLDLPKRLHRRRDEVVGGVCLRLEGARGRIRVGEVTSLRDLLATTLRHLLVGVFVGIVGGFFVYVAATFVVGAFTQISDETDRLIGRLSALAAGVAYVAAPTVMYVARARRREERTAISRELEKWEAWRGAKDA